MLCKLYLTYLNFCYIILTSENKSLIYCIINFAQSIVKNNAKLLNGVETCNITFIICGFKGRCYLMSIYYDYNKIMSYNAFINFLHGERGVGKTYGISKFVVKQFIKNGDEFAYIRRFKTELKEAVPNFFNPLINNKEFTNQLSNKGNKFYCDGKTCGYAMTLSTAQNLKSSNFDKVKYIIFDEYLIEERSTSLFKK